jgi:hypothetical protein
MQMRYTIGAGILQWKKCFILYGERGEHYQTIANRIFHTPCGTFNPVPLGPEEDNGMNDQVDTRTGELLLQFLLADYACSMRDPPFSHESLQQFLSCFGIRVEEVDIHVLEKNFLMQDRVTIGTFFLSFEREGTGHGKKVNAQGIYTIRDTGKEVWVKFTSSTYTFKVHFQKEDSPAVTLIQGNEIVQISPIRLDTARN